MARTTKTVFCGIELGICLLVDPDRQHSLPCDVKSGLDHCRIMRKIPLYHLHLRELLFVEPHECIIYTETEDTIDCDVHDELKDLFHGNSALRLDFRIYLGEEIWGEEIQVRIIQVRA